MLSKKRKVVTVEEKVSLIRAIEKGEKQTDVVRRTGLSQSTVATIWKDRRKWLDAEIQDGSKKKIRKPQYEDLDQAILQWFQQQRINHIPLSGPLIKTKAEFYATELGITDFKASEGWLSKWKQRHNINYGQINGEARDVDRTITDSWLEKVWPGLKARYSAEDIFNADETGLFYKLTPNKTLKFKSEKCIGGKLSKERITVLVAANMTGSVKRKLLVIGKSKSPRCFKNIKRLPVNYKANKSAWMTSQIFEEELRKWDSELKGKKILLLVDNCPAHPAITDLQNIELCFLPANTTSVLQPMDQSVIKSLKSHYRRRLLMGLVESNGNFKVTILDAVQMISRAWAEVTDKTIRHSFKHAGWLEDQVSTEDDDELPLAVWARQFELPSTYASEELQDFENIDDTVATTAGVSDEDILNAVRVDEDEDSEQEELDPEPEPVPTPQQALDAAKVLYKFFSHHEDDPVATNDVSRLEDKVRSLLWKTQKKQTTLKDFFH